MREDETENSGGAASSASYAAPSFLRRRILLLSDSPEVAYLELLDRVYSFKSTDPVDDSHKCGVVPVPCIAVAAYFYFSQCNLTCGGAVESVDCRWRRGRKVMRWKSGRTG
ncbi:Uncharacterized protein TCM_045540 isoform 2 [Theobroma cacao]|uniref:Uncharacterized protein isoform 2 n=1 Tax=Theobroma cacao TaxID=3641 RepID=A0A061FTP3_THECC|nr:Uncharacterized protein TCM_045540 isoform 2 [Theobroma cacao]